MNALLFSEHAEEAAILKLILQQAGFSVRSVKDLNRATAILPEQPTDLVLITLEAEDKKGIDNVYQIRAYTAVPIIIIIEPLSDNLHVSLLEKGVDLVIARPYNVRTLLSQIRALLRRTAGIPFFSLPTLTQADLTLDPGSRLVQVGESKPKRLTQLEFRLLYSLMTYIGQIIPTENIVEQVWGYSGEGNRELVRGLIQRLRSKVEPDPRKPRYIMTEPGVGYYFNRFDD